MTKTSGEQPGNGGITIRAGQVVGNVQSGTYARASYVQHGRLHGSEPAPSAEVRVLLDAVQEVRELLDGLRDEVSETAAGDVDAALDDVEDAVAGPQEPEPGRIRRAVNSVAGALAGIAGLGAAVQALRDATAPWS